MALDPRMGSTIVAEELEKLKQRIIANMQAANAVASGRTIRSLKVVPINFGAKLESQQEMPFTILETGRRGGGKFPRNFTQIIYEWMQAKGVHGTPEPYKTNRPHKYSNAQERGDRSAAFLIARSIREKGTILYQNGGRDTIYSREVPVTIRKVQERLGVFMQAYIVDQISLNTKSKEVRQ